MQNLIQKRLAYGLAVLLLGPVMHVSAASTDVTNAARMVTYFPVPYARYNNIYITDKLDIGTQHNNSFEVEVGSPSRNDYAYSFAAKQVNLRNISSSAPTLQINTDFYTETAVFGHKNTYEKPTVNFTNLYIQQGLNGIKKWDNTGTVKLPSASQFVFYGNTFPGPDTCSTHNLQWISLTFNGTTKKYLVCCSETTGSDDRFNACGEECFGFDTEKSVCENNWSSSFSGQVAGTWDGTGHSGSSCKCVGSSVPSYSAAVTGQSLTKGDLISTSVTDDGKPKAVSYVQQKCWAHTANGTGGHVKTCMDSDGYGSWNYTNCSCTCKGGYKTRDDNAYFCSRYCYKNEEAGNISDCLKTSGASWNYDFDDNKCGCICPTHFKGDGYGCTEKCEAGAPTWGSTVSACTSSDGRWLEDGGLRQKADGTYVSYPACSCYCGIKETDGVKKDRILDGTVCKDPA